MQIIEDINPAEIRLNIKRQVKNMLNQGDTLEAMQDLYTAGQLTDVTVDEAALKLLQEAVADRVSIMKAIDEKFDFFDALSKEFS